MTEWINGRNPVFEVLAAGRRRALKLLVSQGVQTKGRLEEILDRCAKLRLPVERVPRSRLDALGGNHQGVALQCGPYPYCDPGEIYQRLQPLQNSAVILILDLIQDPQNLGTLLRTAEAVGVQGVFLPSRRAASVTPAVTQASSGASEHLWIAQANLAQAIERLQSLGIWVIGLDMDPQAQLPDQVRLDLPLALVVGSEGQGLRRLVRESCDLVMRLPMKGAIGSLNASVAGSVALYLAWQARSFSWD